MQENVFEQHTIDLKCIPNPNNEETCALCEINVT